MVASAVPACISGAGVRVAVHLRLVLLTACGVEPPLTKDSGTVAVAVESPLFVVVVVVAVQNFELNVPAVEEQQGFMAG